MEELFSAIETGSVEKVKEVIDKTAISPTVCSEVKYTVVFYKSDKLMYAGPSYFVFIHDWI